MHTDKQEQQPIVIDRVELQAELSWLMMRVHRVRKLLQLEPIETPRQKKRQRHQPNQ